jgi:hypothetical protein
MTIGKAAKPSRPERMELAERARLTKQSALARGPVRYALSDTPSPKIFARRAGAIVDGDSFVVPDHDRRAVARVARGTRTATIVARTPFRVEDVAVLERRYLVAGGRDGTHVFDLENLSRGPIAVLPGTGGRVDPEPALGALLGDRLLWIRPSTQRSTLWFALVQGKVKRVAALPLPLAIVEVGDRILGHVLFNWIELSGLEALVASARAAAPPARRTAISLQPISDQERPAPPSLPRSFAKIVGRASTWYRVSDSGRAVSFDGEKTGEVCWVDDRQRPHRLRAPVLPRSLDYSDGVVLIALAGRSLLLVDDQERRPPRQLTLPAACGDTVAAFFCAGDLLAVLGAKGLFLATASGKLKAKTPITQPVYVQPFAKGRFLAVTSRAKHGLCIFEVSSGRLRSCFRAEQVVAQHYTVGDRCFFQAPTAAWFEVSGPWNAP